MKHLPLLLLTLAAVSAVEAQPEHAYYGVALGNFEYEERDFGGVPFLEDEASSYRLMVGYQFMEHLAVEGGYGKTGTIRDTFSVFTPGGNLDLSFQGEFQILTIRLVGVLPFDNGIKLLGGLSYSDMKLDFEFTDGVDTASGDEATNEPGYYLAAQYDWDRVAVRLGYEKTDFGSNTDVVETSLSFFYKL